MKILLDTIQYTKKPSGKDIGMISRRITNNIYSTKNIYKIADLIGNRGHTWCPAIFNEKRSKDTFKEIQLVALDFDGGISFDEVKTKSEKYMIPILFAYETFSSINKSKFRIVFMLENVIYDKNIFDKVINMLMTIFNGCDTSCKDISRMFFGGKNLFYYNENNLKVNILTLEMNFELYMKDTYGKTHFRENLQKFYGKISPSPVIYITGNGEKLPNHNLYRKDTLSKLDSSCQLYHEFIADSKWLYYKELFGIALNLINVETGAKVFKKAISNSKYITYKRDWDFYLQYMKKHQYAPMQCEHFCPYAESCSHNTNMLTTTKIKRSEILRTENIEYSAVDEVYADLENSFCKAINSDDNRIHLIKAQTAIGKTQIYINYLSKSDKPCIIAVPTNILKRDVYRRCIEEGIDARMTPSIEDIRNDIPKEIYSAISKFYRCGQHSKVYPYISSILKKQHIPALEKFIADKKELNDYTGNIITTHHRILLSDKNWLKQYQVIIDEDILKTIISNQETIPLSDIEDLLENPLPKKVHSKLTSILYKSEDKEFFKVDKVKTSKNISTDFDMNALLKAKKFYSDGEKLVFYKTPKLKKMKYIVLSATADTFIYKHYFGSDNVKAYECRQAKYLGSLKQYYDGSYSRKYIDTNDNLWDKIRSKIGDVKTITFKKYSSDLDIHFGNSEGCDFLAGENLAVVGTPHMNECVYKFMAYYMGGKTDGALHFRPVEHNGFKFWFSTYENELLRHIQFWLIESELEQCVGRARLLRNECNVYLFSNFPLKQSELVK